MGDSLMMTADLFDTPEGRAALTDARRGEGPRARRGPGRLRRRPARASTGGSSSAWALSGAVPLVFSCAPPAPLPPVEELARGRGRRRLGRPLAPRQLLARVLVARPRELRPVPAEVHPTLLRMYLSSRPSASCPPTLLRSGNGETPSQRRGSDSQRSRYHTGGTAGCHRVEVQEAESSRWVVRAEKPWDGSSLGQRTN